MHHDPVPRFSDARRIVQGVFQELAQDTRYAPRTRLLLASLAATARAVTAAAHAAPRGQGCAPFGFLTRADHPLRVAIAGLSELALGIGEYETIATDPQYAALERFARELREAGADLGAIGAIAEQVQAYAAEETRQACLTRRRSELAERARMLGAMARAAIEQEIERELGPCRLPPAAEELLRDAWQRVLAHAWLEQGPEGMPWRRMLAGLRRFIALWRDGAAAVPRDLADLLCEGLRRAGEAPLRAEILLHSLATELQTWVPPTPPSALMLVEEEPPVPGAGCGGTLEQVDGLPYGAWIAIHDAAGGTRRARLAMRCGEPEQLLLVDRHGRRALSLGREALAGALATGEATLLASTDPIALGLARLRERLARRAIAA